MFSSRFGDRSRRMPNAHSALIHKKRHMIKCEITGELNASDSGIGMVRRSDLALLKERRSAVRKPHLSLGWKIGVTNPSNKKHKEEIDDL